MPKFDPYIYEKYSKPFYIISKFNENYSKILLTNDLYSCIIKLRR